MILPFAHGWTPIGTTRAKAVSKSLPDGNFAGVLIKAPGTTDDYPNTATIYVGDSRVTADNDPITGGFPLAPGESMTIPLKSLINIYTVSASNSQNISWWIQ